MEILRLNQPVEHQWIALKLELCIIILECVKVAILTAVTLSSLMEYNQVLQYYCLKYLQTIFWTKEPV